MQIGESANITASFSIAAMADYYVKSTKQTATISFLIIFDERLFTMEILLTTVVAYQKATEKLAKSTNSCVKQEELEELATFRLLLCYQWLQGLL